MSPERKIFLAFTAVLGLALFLGDSGMSYQEVKTRSDKIKAALLPEHAEHLDGELDRFAAAAVPRCLDSVGEAGDDFKIVVEIHANQEVVRSWRLGDSKLAVCFQQSMQENFVFRPFVQPFYAAFEYHHEKQVKDPE